MEALLLVVSNPVDVLAGLAFKISELASRRAASSTPVLTSTPPGFGSSSTTPRHQRTGRAGFPAHPSIPFNPEPVYYCTSATLQVATVRATASSRAHCRCRASQVHLLAAVSAIAETNQELVASKHQGWSDNLVLICWDFELNMCGISGSYVDLLAPKTDTPVSTICGHVGSSVSPSSCKMST
ncbi:hypothetical protein ACQJBY_059322 [Aegilops geniculata]